MKSNRIIYAGILTLAACLLFVGMAVAGENNQLIDKLVEKNILTASEAAELQGSIVPSWVEKIKLGGDLRLRHDTQWRDEGTDKYHRDRERFRLRLKMTAITSETTEIGIRLASGAGEQNTTNQSFDEHARGKDIFIDQAYLNWQATDFLKIAAGKHGNPLFTSSLVWDPDVNPEGVSESLTFKMSDNAKLFFNLGQWTIEELNEKAFNTDPTLLTWQLGGQVDLADGTALTLAATYYDFIHLEDLKWKAGLLGDDEDFMGYNNRHGQQMIFDDRGNLLNEFGCLEVCARLKMKKVLPVPVSLFAAYIKNLDQDINDLVRDGVDPGDSDPARLLAYGGDDRDTGWQIGFDAGSKKKSGDLYFEYMYQELEDYAFPAVFVDSDFHGGGTNNKGHKAELVYCLKDNIALAATGFFTERQDEAKDGKKDEDRIQLDAILKF